MLPIYQNHQVFIDTTECFAVKVNLAAFVARPILKGKCAENAMIAFNGPYFWGGMPFGDLLTPWQIVRGQVSPDFRPKLMTPLFTFEAGPLLVRDGKTHYMDRSILNASLVMGTFQEDILRAGAEHLCAGLTKEGKLIVAYFAKGHTLDMCADQMVEFGCQYAINCDGGSSAGLQVGEIKRGNPIRFGISLHPRETQ